MKYGDEVVVAYNGETRVLGTVYHEAGCMIPARTFGTRTMPRTSAEDLGRGPCVFCHPTSTKRWLCPVYPARHGRTRLALRHVKGMGLRIVAECATCKAVIIQDEEKARA